VAFGDVDEQLESTDDTKAGCGADDDDDDDDDDDEKDDDEDGDVEAAVEDRGETLGGSSDGAEVLDDEGVAVCISGLGVRVRLAPIN